MTAERLLHATHTLETIQEAVLTGPAAVVTPHTILLGHSLECDLNALQIRHPLCLDTALMFKHPRGAPYKPALKWLSQKYMQKEIQGGKAGHDSEEDARACVGLLKLKEEHGEPRLLLRRLRRMQDGMRGS
jgi:RNA exonuclease 1